MAIKTTKLCECDECSKKLSFEIQRIRSYWLSLNPQKQQQLCRIDSSFVLKKLKGIHRHVCSCPTCGKRRTVFDAEVKFFEEYVKQLERNRKNNQPFLKDEVSNDLSKPPMYMYLAEAVPFGNQLYAKNGKICLKQRFLADQGKRFSELIDACTELYPEDCVQAPHVSPMPFSIHTFRQRWDAINDICDDGEFYEDNEELEEHNVDDCGLFNQNSNDVVNNEINDTNNNNNNNGFDDSDITNSINKYFDSDDSTDGSSSTYSDNEDIQNEAKAFFQFYVARLFIHNVRIALAEEQAQRNQAALLQECEKERLAREEQEQKRKQKQNKNRIKNAEQVVQERRQKMQQIRSRQSNKRDNTEQLLSDILEQRHIIHEHPNDSEWQTVGRNGRAVCGGGGSRQTKRKKKSTTKHRSLSNNKTSNSINPESGISTTTTRNSSSLKDDNLSTSTNVAHSNAEDQNIPLQCPIATATSVGQPTTANASFYTNQAPNTKDSACIDEEGIGAMLREMITSASVSSSSVPPSPPEPCVPLHTAFSMPTINFHTTASWHCHL